MRLRKSLAITLISLILSPLAAQAFDIPLLTWERGREQQVVLGGGAYAKTWTVTLEGDGTDPLTFTASAKNAAGYIVYSIYVPDDLPIGAYSIITKGAGSPRTVVAGVNLIYKNTSTVASSLFDMTLIVAIFIFLTGIISTLRARKYRLNPFASTQLASRPISMAIQNEQNIWDRLESLPYRLRIKFLQSLKPSLFRFILLRDGELTHKISRNFYGVTPFIGLIAGLVTSYNVYMNKGLANTAMTLFIVVTAIAIADISAGFAAIIGYWGFQIISGDISSFRDILIAISVGVSWVGTSFFASLIREMALHDFMKPDGSQRNLAKYLVVVGSSLVGTSVFYFGHELASSIIYTEKVNYIISNGQLILIFGLLLLRGFIEPFIKNTDVAIEPRDETLSISRIGSPFLSFSLLALLFSYIYIWTESALRSLYISLIFSLPYFFLLITFDNMRLSKLVKLPRNILAESALISGLAFIVFRYISTKPLLLDQRADLLLLLGGIAPVIHSIYSTIFASSEEKFSFDENAEIIKP